MYDRDNWKYIPTTTILEIEVLLFLSKLLTMNGFNLANESSRSLSQRTASLYKNNLERLCFFSLFANRFALAKANHLGVWTRERKKWNGMKEKVCQTWNSRLEKPKSKGELENPRKAFSFIMNNQIVVADRIESWIFDENNSIFVSSWFVFPILCSVDRLSKFASSPKSLPMNLSSTLCRHSRISVTFF